MQVDANRLLISLFIILFLKFVSPSGQFFNIKNEICCDGAVYAKPGDDITFTCCNTTLIQYPKDQFDSAPLCCAGRVHKHPEVQSYCCGSELVPINTNDVLCFDEQIVTVSEENKQKNTTQICGTDANNNYIFYNKEEEVCCSGTVYKIRDNFRCCGNSEYDFRYSVCCEERVVYSGESAGTYDSCCGSQPYNSEMYFCCTKLSYQPNEVPKVTETRMYPLNGLTQYDYACCDLKLMKRETQICCESGPKESFGANSCCGEDLIYEANNEMCVAGVKQIRGQIYDCNGQFYNNSDQFCFKNQLYKIDNYMDVCSVNGEWVVFYITKQACTKNGLVDLPPELVGEPHLYCTTLSEHVSTFFFK